MLPVLVERRRADGTQLAAREHRLEQVAGGDGALGGTGTHDRVELVDEEHDLALRRGDLRQHGLEPLLELAPVLGSSDQRADVERPDALALQSLRHIACDDALGEALGDRRLADAGLADQHRVVLRAAREHLDRAPDLLVAADHRVELARLGGSRQVATELRQCLVGSLGILRRHPLAAANLLERAEERLAGHELEREDEVLDRDELVIELARLVERVVQRLPERAARLWRGVRAADRRQRPQARLRLGEHGARVGTRPLQQRARKLLLEQRNGEVIACQLRVAGAARQLLGGGHRLTRLDRQLVEVHGLSFSVGAPAAAADRARPRAGTACGSR